MALKYDFDMFDPDGRARTRCARFRDLHAVRSLRGASEEVKACLRDSGFELNLYDSGAGPGYYPASDGPARADTIERLMDNLEQLPEGADWNGFDIEAFAMAALLAKPLDGPVRAPHATKRQKSDTTPSPSMDAVFGNQPGTQASPVRHAGPDMDSFFSNAKSAVPTPPDSTGPDMDSFFANVQGSGGRAVALRMTADDIRMSLDTAPRRRSGFGPVRMLVMVVGLFFAVTLLGNGTGMGKMVEIATGGKIVAGNR